MQQESIYITTSKKAGVEEVQTARTLAFFLDAKFQKRGTKPFKKIKEKAEKYGCRKIIIVELEGIRIPFEKKQIKAKVKAIKKSEAKIEESAESNVFNLEHLKEFKKNNKIYIKNPKTRRILEVELRAENGSGI